MFFVVFFSLNPYRKVGPDLIIHGVITPYKWSKIKNEFYLWLFHPEINEVTTTTSAPTDITGDFFGAQPLHLTKIMANRPTPHDSRTPPEIAGRLMRAY